MISESSGCTEIHEREEGLEATRRCYVGELLNSAARGCLLKVWEIANIIGADVTTGRSSNDTALMYAASNGHIAVVELLLNLGADINIQNFVRILMH
jgi:ankyrin repeat protein